MKTMRGRGGVVEDIRISNIVMRNIVGEGIVMNMRYQPSEIEPVSERTPAFRKIHISNVDIVDAKKGIAIYGLEEQSIDEVSFSDLSIKAENGIEANYAENIIFDNIRLYTKTLMPIKLDKCEKISFSQIQLLNPSEESCGFNLTDCNTIKISDCFQTDKMKSFLKFNDKCLNLYLTNNILPGVKNIFEGSDLKKVEQINNIQ